MVIVMFGFKEGLFLPMRLVLDDAQNVHTVIHASGTVVWFCVRKGQDMKRVERAIIMTIPEVIEQAELIL